MIAVPIIALELDYPMIPFLINIYDTDKLCLMVLLESIHDISHRLKTKQIKMINKRNFPSMIKGLRMENKNN